MAGTNDRVIIVITATYLEKINHNRSNDFCHTDFNFFQLEDKPHDTLAFIMIGDLLYGNSNTEVSSQRACCYIGLKIKVQYEDKTSLPSIGSVSCLGFVKHTI